MSERYRRAQKLDALFKRSELIGDAETLSHWARYLCVQTYGYVERSFVEIIEDYCRACCCPRTFSFVSYKLKFLNNVSAAEVEEVLGIMDASWRTAFIDKFRDTVERDHFTSVMHNRNKVSHGEDSGLRLSTITEYRKSVDRILDFIEALVA